MALWLTISKKAGKIQMWDKKPDLTYAGTYSAKRHDCYIFPISLTRALAKQLLPTATALEKGKRYKVTDLEVVEA